MNISDANKEILIRVVETMLSHDPNEPGSPIEINELFDVHGRVRCKLCGVTWHFVEHIREDEHMDQCPVRLIDRLDRQL